MVKFWILRLPPAEVGQVGIGGDLDWTVHLLVIRIQYHDAILTVSRTCRSICLEKDVESSKKGRLRDRCWFVDDVVPWRDRDYCTAAYTSFVILAVMLSTAF